MSVLIGKTRRVTLAELQSLAYGSAVLQLHSPDDDGADAPVSLVDSMDEAVSAIKATTGSLLSPADTVAALTVFVLNMSQGRIARPTLAQVATLVDFVNTVKAKEAQLSSDPEVFLSTIQTVIDGSLDSIPSSLVARSIQLGVGSLAAVRAKLLSQVSTAVAALSAERCKANSTSYAEVNFDVNRPHRGLVTSASALRALLNGSKFVTAQSKTDSVPPAISSIPQYQGPAEDGLKAACKTLELEVNCFESGIDTVLDNTVAVLAMQQALQAAETLGKASAERMGQDGTAPGVDKANGLAGDLSAAVEQLDNLLTAEAKMGVEFVRVETSKAEEDAKKKEAEKAARAQGGPGGPGKPADGKDEFAGMSEEKKAKILKKRAEKEAKAAKKRAAKQNKGVALFGMGIQPLCTVLKENDFVLSEKSIGQIEQIIDKLLSGGVQRKPKIPKGTRDYLPEQMMIRQQAFTIIRRVFQSHGAVEIDTPVFELKDTLTGKYGEDSKLIYDLADQGGELLALRYDLTVPFARFLALNSVGNIKRFHIGKVYRRDQPALARGRYREFYQCDFDIAGSYGRMVPDSECVCVVCDILDALPIGDFGIKLNHRRLLDGILDLCGVPSDKFRTICSAVDKLDKEPWSEVKREMVEDKGLNPEVADKIGTFVTLKGKPWELYNSLLESKKFGTHANSLAALEDLKILFEYLESMGKLQFISFDLSLARGLDYYTGVIYEAVCMSGNTQVGSIGGGGRYDNLVSMFQEAGKVTPCVGVSVGIERVFTLMEARIREDQGGSIKQPNVNVLVASVGDGMMKHRMRVTRMLWDANISAEFSQQDNPKLKYELSNALDRGIPYMVIVGEEELKENKCKVKDLKARTEDTVPLDELVSALRSKGVIPVGCEFAAELLGNNESS